MRLRGFVEPGDRQALQQPDPLVQGRGEIDLAVHGARGDAGDPVAQAEEVGELVQHLVLDHGRFHVGHQQPLAPVGGRHDDRVDAGQRRRRRPCRRTAGRRRCPAPASPACRPTPPLLHSSSAARCTRLVVEQGLRAIGDQDEGVLHASGSSKLPRAWPSRTSSSSPDRLPAASRRWRSPWPSARGGTVINADAMQTYDAFPILTAQPRPAERARAPHALYGVLPLSETLSAARWRDLAAAEIERCRRCRHPVRRLGSLSARPDAGHFRHSRQSPPSSATQANADWDAMGAEAFRARLAERDPAIVARLKPGDRQRHVRAWEVRAGDRPAAQRLAEGARASRRPGGSRPSCWRPTAPGCAARIETRFDVDAGGRRAGRGPRGVRPASPIPDWPGPQGAWRAGALCATSAGELALDEARQIAIDHTRQYAKRQMTWFRHQLTPDLVVDPSADQSLERPEKFLDKIRGLKLYF